MRIATWNVNSLRARMERVQEWLEYANCDVVCLQETKMADAAFPAMAFAALGYDSAHHGSGGYNGVAILSRVGVADVVRGFGEGIEPDPDARLVSADCAGVRVASAYVPNGRSLDNPHYAYKLSWLARLRRHLEATADPEAPVAVCGDFNVAPDDRDVWDPAAFVGSTHVSEPERAALAEVCDWGLVDAFRLRYDDDGLYSWWDYRNGAFRMRRGMRIDFVLLSHPLSKRLAWALIDRNARKGKAPSDHAPVVVELAAA